MLKLMAKDIMNPNVITVSSDMTLPEVASLFTSKMISGAPVVDGKGKLVGVVSLSDIAEATSRRLASISPKDRSEFYEISWEDRLSPEDMEGVQLEIETGMRVRDVMTPIIMCVSEDTHIAEMADLMIGGRIHRLLVTRQGQLVGIVTTMDMLKVIRDRSRKKTDRIPKNS